MNTTIKQLILFLIGGISYIAIEIAYRGYSHWSMFLVGGFCFVLIGLINEVIPWDMPLKYQMLLGAVIVTAIELISGLYLNIYLKLGVWDYSHMPFNIMGQICLPFSIAWYFISGLAIALDDYLRWKLFGEDKPHYN